MDKTEQHKKAMLEALEQSLGVVTSACKSVGIGRTTHYLWMDLSEQIRSFLAEISLGDLMRRQEVRAISENQDTRVPGRIDQEAVPLTLIGSSHWRSLSVNFRNLKDHVARTD